MADPTIGLVHLGGGRRYDPALGRPLQPNSRGAAIASALVGAAYGNVPGAVVGIAVGLTYEFVLAPYAIRPGIVALTGEDPYDKTRKLAPLK